MPIDRERSYEVPSQVAVRREKFGGLIYRYDNRALLFFHSLPLVDFLLEMNPEKPVGDSLDEYVSRNDMGETQRQAIENALGQLETKGIIRELRSAA